MTPLGETLRRARTAKGITLEDAERVTRIPRKYLEALELENYGILPAPVFARGFLRSYAGYLGLDPQELLPLFPVGHVEEPSLENLPEVKEPRTWNANSIIAASVIGVLILIVFALYSIGREDSSEGFLQEAASNSRTVADNPAVVPAGPAEGGVPLPDLLGLSVESAVQEVTKTGADYVLVGVREGDIPSNQVVDQSHPPGTLVGPGDTVTIYYQR
jgi:transcriptional regulator with XRE-family HTH domain